MKIKKKTYYFLTIFMLLFTLAVSSVQQSFAAQTVANTDPVYILPINSTIGPAITRYIKDSIAIAQTNKAQLIIIELNNTSGLISTTQDIANLIKNAQTPVAVYLPKPPTEKNAITTSIINAAHITTHTAPNRETFIKQIDHTSIESQNGDNHTLNLSSAEIIEQTPNLTIKIASFLTNPNTAIILLSIGIGAIILEFFISGTMIAGTIGATALLAGIYSIHILSVNITGLLLLLASFCLLLAEIFVPSFGILGLSGIAAFVFSTSILFENSDMVGISLDAGLIWGIAATGLLIMMASAYTLARTLKNQARPKGSTGAEGMIGETAEIIEWNGHEGLVHIQGEIWQAWSERDQKDFKKGDRVFISQTQDLRLKIRSQE